MTYEQLLAEAERLLEGAGEQPKDVAASNRQTGALLLIACNLDRTADHLERAADALEGFLALAEQDKERHP